MPIMNTLLFTCSKRINTFLHGSYSSKATHGMVSGDPPVTTSISPRHPRQGDAIHMLASQENKNNIRNIEGRLNFPRLFQPVTLSR